MKKTLLCLVFIFVICASVFSQKIDEAWHSVGLSFGNYFERGKDIENMYMGSIGIDLGLYCFYNRKNIGLFASISYLIPVVNNLNGINEPVTQFSTSIGPGFRLNINETMNLHFGLGINVQLLDLYGKQDSQVKFMDRRVLLGIGGDIAFKYDLNDMLYLDFGIKLSYHFLAARLAESTPDNWTTTIVNYDSFVKNYAMFEARPYIAIGLNYYGERGRHGKPGN